MNRATVPATVLLTVGSTELVRIRRKQAPSVKPLIAGFLMGSFLYAVAMMDDRIATLFAVLIVTTVLMENGIVLFPLIGGMVK